MKKLLSILTALIMMALPLSGLALTSSTTPVPQDPAVPVSAPVSDPDVPEEPTVPVSAPVSDPAAPASISAPDPEALLANAGFAAKYLAEGQRLVTDVTLEPGQALLEDLDEEGAAALKDLLEVMTLETTAQQNEGMVQAALRLLLEGESAADVILAAGEDGFYVSSGFLGTQIVNVTPDQLDDLADTFIQQMINEGALRQEDLSDLTQGIQTLSEAFTALAELDGADMDMTALQEAIDGLKEETSNVEELTEVPEGVTIPAKYRFTLTMTKEALKNVTTELAKFLWSVPSMPKLLSLSDEEWTEESLVNTLNQIPDILQEDLVITVYLDEAEENIELQAAPKLLLNEKTADMNAVLITNAAGDSLILSATLYIPEEGSRITQLDESLVLYTGEAEGLVQWYYTVNEINGEESTMTAMDYIAVTWETTDTESAVKASLLSAAMPSQEEEPVTMTVDLSWEAQDLGDHAEAAGTILIGRNDPGDLMTVYVAQTTDLAEAYIITPDAVQPMAMTEAEREKFTARAAFSSLLETARLISRLPSSVQVLFWRMITAQ